MISLNTYSFGIGMGLVKGTKKKKFQDFVKFLKKNKLSKLEFPIDYFSKKENRKIDFYFKLLKKSKVHPIIDLEDLDKEIIRHLVKLNKIFNYEIIRIKMSNFFGGNRYLVKNFKKTQRNFIRKLKESVKLIENSKLKFAIRSFAGMGGMTVLSNGYFSNVAASA